MSGKEEVTFANVEGKVRGSKCLGGKVRGSFWDQVSQEKMCGETWAEREYSVFSWLTLYVALEENC